MSVAHDVAQKQEDHDDDEPERQQAACASRRAPTDRSRPIGRTASGCVRRSESGVASSRARRRTALATATVFVPGCRCTARTIARDAVEPARASVVLDVVEHIGRARRVEPRRRCDTRRSSIGIAAALLKLAVRLQRVRGRRPPEHAGGLADVLRVDRRRRPRRCRSSGTRARSGRAGCAPRTWPRRTPAPARRRRSSTGAAPISVSPTSSSCVIESVVDVSAKNRIGDAAGFAF